MKMYSDGFCRSKAPKSTEWRENLEKRELRKQIFNLSTDWFASYADGLWEKNTWRAQRVSV